MDQKVNQAQERINSFLQTNNLAQLFALDPNIYIGGSLPFLCFGSPNAEFKATDIDIYTKCSATTLRNFNKWFGLTAKSFVRTGVNISFYVDEFESVQIQLITSEFNDFVHDVLEEYDCTMCKVGYHPASQKILAHNDFVQGLSLSSFKVEYEKSNPTRIEKLKQRAKIFFGSKLIVIKSSTWADYRPYWKNKTNSDSLNDVLPSPPYIQLYAHKYLCVGCKTKQSNLLCGTCAVYLSSKFDPWIITTQNKSPKTIVIFGGVNGLGKIIGDQAQTLGWDVYRTGRNPTVSQLESSKYFAFDMISTNPNKKLLELCASADYVIFNAYQTLEFDQKIWTTTLDTFDSKLSELRFKVNCWGYVRLLQKIKEARIQWLQTRSTEYKDQIYVWMDANESKFDDKLQDGKHLELNMAKTACKQIFYTNGKLFAGLGVLTVCYDPGWLSFHGISVDQIESKSKFLIPPKFSALGLLEYIETIGADTSQLYADKKFTHDMSCYKCFDKIFENKP